MARLHIDNPITSGFSMVPNVLWRWPGLSFKAKAFMAYLLSHRDGSCPPVAAMEQETGLGRDARKAAMAELIAAGLARWVIERDGAGRLLSKRLEVTTRPLLVALARAPENPSHGHRAPEKPSDGKPVATATESRRLSPENPAILQNRKEKEGAPAPERPATARRSPPDGRGGPSVQLAELGQFQRAYLREGKGLLWSGGHLPASHPTARRLLCDLRAEDAGEGGASRSGAPLPPASGSMRSALQ